MPALPDVPQVLRIDMHFSIGQDQFAKCRFFLRYSGTAPTATELNTFAAAIGTAWGTDIAPFASTAVQLTEVVVTDLTSSTAAVGSDSTVHSGTNASAVPTADACFLESRTILRRFRGGHPRIYWPTGTTTDLQNAQTWTAAFVAAAGPATTLFHTDVQGSGWSGSGSLTPVSVSYYSGFTVHTGTTGRARNVSTVRPVPLVDVVTGSAYHEGVASQRRRLLKLA